MRYHIARIMIVTALVCLLTAVGCHAANPPICPHVIGWNSEIGTWAEGAPWIKVIYSWDIAPAQATGAKVFYRPYDADSTYHDDGCLPSERTGASYADLVWAKISGMSKKPDAVSYRNEFNWGDVANGQRTCTEFINYYDRLRQLGYQGKIIFGSFGVGWVDSAVWEDPSVKAAAQLADGIETHEYFDFTVTCCAPWLCFRHRDIAIGQHSYLQGKEWYIGEFGSDCVCNACPECGDPLCRSGWQDNGKLTEEQYIEQLGAYRTGCADEVVAVFVFQQGAPNWAAFETMGTSVADWMKTTWDIPTGSMNGIVRSTTGLLLEGATITVSPGGYTATTQADGSYTVNDIAAGTYSVTADKEGYGRHTQTDQVVEGGQITTTNFYLLPIMSMSMAKERMDGLMVLVSGTVTARFPVDGSQQRIYVQNADRSCGIAVDTSIAFSPGDEVQVKGTMDTIDGERVITYAQPVLIQSATPVPDPLGMANKALGGGPLGHQPAVLDDSADVSYAQGLNNVGLLVRTWGRVSYVDPQGAFFYLNDGCELSDGSGHTGVRVACTGLQTPSDGSFIVATGISGATTLNSKTVRLLRPRSDADLSYSAAVNYLSNPGFEVGNTSYWTTYGSVDGAISGGWFGGITAHSGDWFVGSAADGGTKSGGWYQRVAVPSGQSYYAKAWSCVFRGDIPDDSVQNRVGIDPTGGTNPNAPAVVWSATDTPSATRYWEWHELTTPTVASEGGYVTIFLDAQHSYPVDWHISCFDDAGVYNGL